MKVYEFKGSEIKGKKIAESLADSPKFSVVFTSCDSNNDNFSIASIERKDKESRDINKKV